MERTFAGARVDIAYLLVPMLWLGLLAAMGAVSGSRRPPGMTRLDVFPDKTELGALQQLRMALANRRIDVPGFAGIGTQAIVDFADIE